LTYAEVGKPEALTMLGLADNHGNLGPELGAAMTEGVELASLATEINPGGEVDQKTLVVLASKLTGNCFTNGLLVNELLPYIINGYPGS
jgi:hypothetical protein